MFRLYTKNQLTFSLAWILFYVVSFCEADKLSASLGISKVVTAPVSVVLVLILFIFLHSHGLKEQYGLCALIGNVKNFLYFIPLAFILSINLWNGVSLETSPLETVLFVLSMLCVGFIEEMLFRGFLFKTMCKDNVKVAILVSSLTFGFGHILNLFRSAEFFSTLLQVCYATAIGFLFTMIFYKGKSLWPCIIAHGIMNVLSGFGVQGAQTSRIITALILCIVSVGYALWIWKKTPSAEKFIP